MSAGPRLQIVAANPLFGVENDVRSVTDKLTILMAYFHGNTGAALSETEGRAVDRLIIETLGSARTVEAAWDAQYRGRP